MSNYVSEFKKKLDHLMYVQTLASEPYYYGTIKDTLPEETQKEVEEGMKEREKWRRVTTLTREDLDRRFTI